MRARRTSSCRTSASRLRHRVQLTTDGHKPYLVGRRRRVRRGHRLRHAVEDLRRGSEPEKRYSPAGVPRLQGGGGRPGQPDPKHISTSYVERQNLTMRMSIRRFTRLTNAFSKKIENHAAAVALYFMYYNFGRVHQTLRVTPAMEAGVSDHVWSVEEIVGVARLSARETRTMLRRWAELSVHVRLAFSLGLIPAAITFPWVTSTAGPSFACSA